MICPACGKETNGKFGDLCPLCEKRQASRRKRKDDKTPFIHTHRPLPGGDTGRLREVLKFFAEIGWRV